MNSNNQLQDVIVTNSNREFRKIKSSKFLYEINSNGTIVRNIKSKKQLKIELDYHYSEKGYYFVRYQSQQRSIAALVAECWLGDIPIGYTIDHIDKNLRNNDYTNLRYIAKDKRTRKKPIQIINVITQEIFTFVSQLDGAKFLAKILNLNIESIRQRLKKKRSHIKGYDIIYLNAETASNHSTE